MNSDYTSHEPVIVVEDVYKRYPRNERRQRTLRHEAAAIIRDFLKREEETEVEPFYALHAVSFTISQGEAVGIIGRNGSGKTTLLRMLSGITRPTSGDVEVKGRYAALISLGAGFKTELTGRKNIYLNAAIYGVPPREVDQIMEPIIDFSELHDFIDLPVNRYSSGMMARLGFSIMVHILPDIVLIDEVLAVGDAAFQDKCMARIEEMKRDRRTIVFVSHSQAAVEMLCERSIWLHNGKLLRDGPTTDVFAEYNAFLDTQSTIQEGALS